MSPGTTFERVYLALKEQIGSGRFAPGEHVEPGPLSCELNSSITPVRDALHRLVGERLVEAPRSDGFRMPFVTEMGLRHLYDWNAKVLILAARTQPAVCAGAQGSAVPEIGPVEAVEQLFLDIAGRTRNPEHVDAVARLNDRLRAIRRIELDLIAEPSPEIAVLEKAHRSGNSPTLRTGLAAYHRRRMRLAAQLVAALQDRRRDPDHR